MITLHQYITTYIHIMPTAIKVLYVPIHVEGPDPSTGGHPAPQPVEHMCNLWGFWLRGVVCRPMWLFRSDNASTCCQVCFHILHTCCGCSVAHLCHTASMLAVCLHKCLLLLMTHRLQGIPCSEVRVKGYSAADFSKLCRTGRQAGR
jgi:hypothetical protein